MPWPKRALRASTAPPRVHPAPGCVRWSPAQRGPHLRRRPERGQAAQHLATPPPTRQTPVHPGRIGERLRQCARRANWPIALPPCFCRRSPRRPRTDQVVKARPTSGFLFTPKRNALLRVPLPPGWCSTLHAGTLPSRCACVSCHFLVRATGSIPAPGSHLAGCADRLGRCSCSLGGPAVVGRASDAVSPLVRNRLAALGAKSASRNRIEPRRSGRWGHPPFPPTSFRPPNSPCMGRSTARMHQATCPRQTAHSSPDLDPRRPHPGPE